MYCWNSIFLNRKVWEIVSKFHVYDLIKNQIPYLRKNTAFEKFLCDRNNSFIKRQLNILQDRMATSIEVSKQKYYCRMTNKLISTQNVQKLTGHC